eukprot:4167558-Pyramimonas_sp.AAC.2
MFKCVACAQTTYSNRVSKKVSVGSAQLLFALCNWSPDGRVVHSGVITSGTQLARGITELSHTLKVQQFTSTVEYNTIP